MADNDQVGAGQSVGRSGEEASNKEHAPGNAKLDRRRKFLIGGLSTAPVIATLASRPAWAGANCPYSDRMSDHMSEDPVKCAGDDVSNWQNNPEKLSAVFNVGPANPIYGPPDYTVMTRAELRQAKKQGLLTQEQIKAYKQELSADTPTLFTDVFRTYPPTPDPPDATMMQCLMTGSLGGECVAAYCNAYFYESDFGYKQRSIVKMVKNGIETDPDTLYRMLWYLNNNMQGPHPWGNNLGV